MTGEDHKPHEWPFPLFGSLLVGSGLLLILIFLPVREAFWHPYVEFAADFFLEVGKAALITGGIAWLLEIAHVAAYFEDRLFRVFMNPRFLQKLDDRTLRDVHRAISTFLFGGPDDTEAQDYYRYLTEHHMRLAGETYRRNMDVTFEIEPWGEPPVIKTTTVITYTVVPVASSSVAPQIYKVPSPFVIDAVAGTAPRDHIVEWTSTVIYQDGTKTTDEKYDAAFEAGSGDRKVEVKKDFSFPLHGEVTYHEKTVCKTIMAFPWAMDLSVVGRTKEVTLALRWPLARKFDIQAYGELSARSTRDITSLGATFHYDDWMVAGHGVFISVLPPKGYEEYGLEAGTDAERKMSPRPEGIDRAV